MDEPSAITADAKGDRRADAAGRGSGWRAQGGRPRRASRLQTALDREWFVRVARGPAPVPDGWRADPRLCRYRFVVDALAELEDQSTPPERAEAIAEALAMGAAAGDEMAARVMLQHLMPCLASMAWGGGFAGGATTGEESDALDSMLSTVWLSLATGEALRGSAGVLRRLLRDAEYRVLQRPRRRRAREEAASYRSGAWSVSTCGAVADITGRPQTGTRPAGEELAEVVCEARRAGLALSDARLLWVLGLAGVSVSDAARLDPDRVSSRCIRYRRAAALRRVRQLTSAA